MNLSIDQLFWWLWGIAVFFGLFGFMCGRLDRADRKFKWERKEEHGRDDTKGIGRHGTATD